MINEYISLEKFLNQFCNIYNNNLYKIKHKDIKQLMPEIKRCSFEFLKNNPELQSNGSIILVKDITGNIIPYLKPIILINEDASQVYMTIEKEKDNIDELSKHELIELLHRTRNKKKSKEIREEIKNKQFKKEK